MNNPDQVAELLSTDGIKNIDVDLIKNQTLTKLKKGKNLNLAFCDTQPVAKHYTIGQKLGISGTPAIVTKSGELFPGYYPPDELLEKLKG